MNDRPPLRVQIKLKHPPEAIFTALTSSAALQTWFAEQAEIDLGAQRYDFWGRFTPENPDQEAGQHALLELEPDRRIKFAWQWGEQPTTVAFTLHPRGDHTILAVEHVGGHHDSHQAGLYTMEDFWFLSLENLRRYLDGKPADARVDFSQPLTGDIEHHIDIDAPANQVFAALIRPDQLERWIASKARIEPQPDGDYDIGWGMAFKILEIEPDHKLVYTMPAGPDENHIVTWTLEESGGKTRLTIVHSGFGLDENTGGLKAGWRNFTGWVRSLVEYGPDWQPPIVPLTDDSAAIYPASIARAQDELVW